MFSMGVLVRINISAGGLPKKPVPCAGVKQGGVEGDVNLTRSRKMNHAPDQALLIIPEEHIESLRSEGWPLEAGSWGENFTTRGIGYDEFHVGDRFLAGEVEFEISKPCDPCRKLRVYGAGILAALKNRRGWYARVLKEGRVRAGDSVLRLNG